MRVQDLWGLACRVWMSDLEFRGWHPQNEGPMPKNHTHVGALESKP